MLRLLSGIGIHSHHAVSQQKNLSLNAEVAVHLNLFTGLLEEVNVIVLTSCAIVFRQFYLQKNPMVFYCCCFMTLLMQTVATFSIMFFRTKNLSNTPETFRLNG